MANKIYYKIISVDNRAETIIEKNKSILKHLGFIEAEGFDFIDGRIVDAVEILKNKNFSLEKWSPWDKRSQHMIMSTEAAIWLNNIAVYEYIVKNNIDHFLMIEDDTELVEDFKMSFRRIFKEIPASYDFVSLIDMLIQEPHRENRPDNTTKIDKKYFIHKSFNQYSHFNCILISNKGAKKILNFLYNEGVYYTNDCQIFDLSRRRILDGYSIRPDSKIIIGYPKNLTAIIDADNERNNLVVFDSYKYPEINSKTINYSDKITPLCQIGGKFGTDKSSICTTDRLKIADRTTPVHYIHTLHAYTPFYYDLFKNFIDKKIVFGEIGILYGSSIKMWRAFFNEAKIFGFDYDAHFISKSKDFKLKDVDILHMNIKEEASIESALYYAVSAQNFHLFDILIEDSTHILEDQIRFIKIALKYLNNNGILIIEDIFIEENEKKYLNLLSDSFTEIKTLQFITIKHNLQNDYGHKNSKIMIIEKK